MLFAINYIGERLTHIDMVFGKILLRVFRKIVRFGLGVAPGAKRWGFSLLSTRFEDRFCTRDVPKLSSRSERWRRSQLR
jgi:hypothetical protein